MRRNTSHPELIVQSIVGDEHMMPTEIEDQGTRVADRTSEHLAASDVGVVLVRKIWMRELTAFKNGRPLTPWRYDPNLPLLQADEG